jgi:alanine racemase
LYRGSFVVIEWKRGLRTGLPGEGSKIEQQGLRLARMEIDRSAIRANYRAVKQLLRPECRIMSVVKADAYGLGLVPVARLLASEGCSLFAVATVAEGAELRLQGLEGEILVLGSIPERQVTEILRWDLCATCGDLSLAGALGRAGLEAGRPARLHVKVDTGLGRIGFPPEEALTAVKAIRSMEGTEISGIYTHFATADESNLDYARWQGERFLEVLRALEEEGIRIPLRHACNSAGILNCPELHLDAVRCGIFLYGLPSGYASRPIGLSPVFEVKSELVAVRELPARHPVGYGLRYVTRGATRIGVIPVGFNDGFLRGTKYPEVLVRGARVPVVGSVCMDQMMVDLAGVPGASKGDEVVLIGRQGGEEITAIEYAARIDSIPAQAMTLFSRRVARVYKGGEDHA